MILIIIDAHSKWPEIVDIGICTTAEKIILVLKKLFAHFGLSNRLVTDNGSQL